MDDPLLDRILSPTERQWMEEADTGELWSMRLWALWAAKEAAYKVYCKLSAGGPFLPRMLSCRLDAQETSDEAVVRIRGVVRRRDGDLPVTVEGSSNRSFVHLIGWDGAAVRPLHGRLEVGLEEVDLAGPETQLEALRQYFSPAEWAGVHSFRSARARLVARERIRQHLPSAGRGGEVGEVEILTPRGRPGQSPPSVWFGGREVPDLDLSLSHHGRFVAWALLVPEVG